MLYGIADPRVSVGMSDAVIGRRGIGRHAAYVLRANPVTAVAALGASLLVFVAVFAPRLAPYDPIASNVPTPCSRPRRRTGPAPTSSAATS